MRFSVSSTSGDLSHRAIAQACAIGVGTVSLYLQRAAQGGLGWPPPAELDDAALEARLFRRAAPAHDRVRPDCADIHRELKRDGVTLQLLWEEYAQVHPNGYRRTQFCEIYRQWARRLRPSMRQVHRAGEKTFIDFSGKRPTLVDPRTGEVRRVELFVAVLGASSFTYAEATATQQLPDWGRRPHPHGRVLRGHDRLVGPRPAQERRHASLPLRARRQSHHRGGPMLIEQTLDKLNAMKLGAMADACQQQLQTDEAAALGFENRFGLLVDVEWTAREQRKLQRRLRTAKLRYPATLEAVDFTHPRRLNRQQVLTLGAGAWIAERHNLLLIGPTGIGKSFLSCALVERACRRGFTARYVRMMTAVMPTARRRAGRPVGAGLFGPPTPVISAVRKDVSTTATVNAPTAPAAA